MRHFASPAFWDRYEDLPERIRRLADANFTLLKADPRHPSLHLKRAGRFWSVRVGLGHRALAREQEGDLIWFWIGTHAEYDRILGRQGERRWAP